MIIIFILWISSGTDTAFECSYCSRRSRDLLRYSRCKEVNYCSKDFQKGHWEEGHKEHCKTSGSQGKIMFQAHISYNRNHNINTHTIIINEADIKMLIQNLLLTSIFFCLLMMVICFTFPVTYLFLYYRLKSKIISEFFFGGGERKSNSNVTRLIWIIKSYMIPILKFRCNGLSLRNCKNKEAKTDLHLITLKYQWVVSLECYP